MTLVALGAIVGFLISLLTEGQSTSVPVAHSPAKVDLLFVLGLGLAALAIPVTFVVVTWLAMFIL